MQLVQYCASIAENEIVSQLKQYENKSRNDARMNACRKKSVQNKSADLILVAPIVPPAVGVAGASLLAVTPMQILLR